MKRKCLFSAIVLLCLGCFVFSGYKILTILWEYHMGEKTYDSFRQDVVYIPNVPASTVVRFELGTEPPSMQPESTEATAVESKEKAPVNFPVIDFDSLLEINSDAVAWVYIEDTNISYPVVQGEDNEKYMSMLIDGSRNAAGSIFMDYRNEPGFIDQNTVLYGHHMKNGTMFAGIRNYRDQAYYNAHPYVLIMTPDQNYQFEIVAAYVAHVTDSAWKMEFSSAAEQQEWIDDAISRSSFISAAVPKPGDRFLTLSTCSYEFHDARFVLVAVLKD